MWGINCIGFSDDIYDEGDMMERIFTERAHLMCPHMNFGIVMSVVKEFDEEKIRKAFERLSDAHPFLRSYLGYDKEDNSYFYDVTDSSKIGIKISDSELKDFDDPKILLEYDSLIGCDWDISKEGMLKTVVWKQSDKTVFLLAFHHLLADGRGALNLALELADIYAKDEVRQEVTEKLISSADDLPQNLGLPFLSRKLVEKANRDWEKEGCEILSYQRYHEFADSFVKNDKVTISINRTCPDDVKKMAGECREHSVTINDLLMARMYQKEKTDKIIIAKDIRDSLSFYNKGALGNYSTAFSVVIKNAEKDIWTLADKIHKKVQKKLQSPKDLYLVLQCYACLKPEVLDAAFMAAKGAFKSKSAEFIGKMFFGFDSPKGYSITNLGRIESKNVENAFFIPPASPAIRKTAGVLTINGQMTECICERNKTMED